MVIFESDELDLRLQNGAGLLQNAVFDLDHQPPNIVGGGPWPGHEEVRMLLRDRHIATFGDSHEYWEVAPIDGKRFIEAARTENVSPKNEASRAWEVLVSDRILEKNRPLSGLTA